MRRVIQAIDAGQLNVGQDETRAVFPQQVQTLLRLGAVGPWKPSPSRGGAVRPKKGGSGWT